MQLPDSGVDSCRETMSRPPYRAAFGRSVWSTMLCDIVMTCHPVNDDFGRRHDLNLRIILHLKPAD